MAMAHSEAGVHNRAERGLTIALRIIGIAALCAIPAIFFPYSWMNAVHQVAGLGQLPDDPIVSYLSRSLSLFYAGHGVIALYAASDVRRNHGLVKVLGWLFLITGLTILGIDLHAGMPTLWTVSESPFAIVVGGLVLVLQRHIQRAS
jgi:hypothetical protein